MRLRFETKQIKKKCALSSEPNDFMRIIESKKVRQEFETEQIQKKCALSSEPIDLFRKRVGCEKIVMC